MQSLELKAECTRKNISLSQLASAISINPASLYRKMNGETDFLRNEICKIAEVLNLSDAQVMSIFFHQ